MYDPLVKQLLTYHQLFLCLIIDFQEAFILLSSPVHKFLFNFSATLGFFSNFQLAEQLSMYRATSKLLCLDSHSHTPAKSETIKKYREFEYGLCREYVYPIP